MRYVTVKNSSLPNAEIFLAYILLFVYGLNIFNRYVYISYFVAGISLLFVLIRHKVHLSPQPLFVFTFLVGYYLLASFINGESKLELVSQCALFYVFGAVSYQCANGQQNKMFKMVAFGTSGFAIYGIITSFYSVLDSGRYLQDVWGGGRLAATQVAAWCMMYMAFVPWLIFKGKEIGRAFRAILYLLMVLSVISFFILSSRTGLIVSVLIILMILVISIREKQNKILVSLVAVFFLAILAYTFDVAGLRTAFWNSNLILRMVQKQSTLGSAFDTGRVDRWIYVLTHFTDKMSGGYFFSGQLGGMIHNFFLDLYDECGIVSLVLFALIVARLIWGMSQINRRSIDLADKIGLMAWFAVISILFLSEPVLYYGRTNLMAFFFFMIAMVEFSGPIAYREELVSGGQYKE